MCYYANGVFSSGFFLFLFVRSSLVCAVPLSTIWTSAFVVKTLALAGLLVFFISLTAVNSVLESLLIRQSYPRYHSAAVALSI